jgi:hypothetical protein
LSTPWAYAPGEKAAVMVAVTIKESTACKAFIVDTNPQPALDVAHGEPVYLSLCK